MQCQNDLCAKAGRSKLIDANDEPCHGPADAQRASTADAQIQANSSHLQGHDGQDHSGDSAPKPDHQCLASTLCRWNKVPISTTKAKAKLGGQSVASSPNSWEIPVGDDMATALETQMAESIDQ